MYDGIRHLVLFGGEKYDSIYNRIRYLIKVKSGISYIIFYNYGTTNKDLYNSLQLEKTVTVRNFIILVKSVWNKDKNN